MVVYAGSAMDRSMIAQYEFYYPGDRRRLPRFNVLLTTYEMVLKDRPVLGQFRCGRPPA